MGVSVNVEAGADGAKVADIMPWVASAVVLAVDRVFIIFVEWAVRVRAGTYPAALTGVGKVRWIWLAAWGCGEMAGPA